MYSSVESILKEIKNVLNIHFVQNRFNFIENQFYEDIFHHLLNKENVSQFRENGDLTNDVEFSKYYTNKYKYILHFQNSQFKISKIKYFNCVCIENENSIYYEIINPLLSILGCYWGFDKIINDLNDKGVFYETIEKKHKKSINDLKNDFADIWKDQFKKLIQNMRKCDIKKRNS